MTEKGFSRRDFLTTGTGVAAAGLLGVPPGGAADPPATSRVVLVRSRDVLNAESRADPDELHRMLNQAVAALFEEDNAGAAWRRVVSPSDVVGIKTNVWSHLPTPPALEDAIRSEVLAVGVNPDDVSVDDRGVRTNPVFQRATAIINTRPM